jgi:hypothetical protein
MGKIFVSHAVADRELVDAFVDFLQTGCGVVHDDIFCSSLEGMTIPEGSTFVTFIEEALRDAEFVIMIISPSYYESMFCLCELGATWILQHNNFPMLVPPLDWSDLKAVLNPRQGGKINDASDLANLYDRLEAIDKGKIATARFQLKRDGFLERLKTLKISGRTSVSAKDYNELKTKYDAAVMATVEYEDEIRKLKSQFAKLASKKDKNDVREILLAGSDEPKQFANLKEAFKSISRNLPSPALEAMFYRERGEDYRLPPYFASEHIYETAQQAAARDFVEIEENQVTLNSAHPVVSAALVELRKIEDFLLNASDAFRDNYEDENDHPFSITNRDFWEKNLGL